MAVLLIMSDVSPETLDGSALGRSLARQEELAWTLDPADPDIDATVLVDHTTALRAGALAALREVLDAHPDIDAIVTDAIIDGERALRPTWGPTAAPELAAATEVVACRGRTLGGALANRIDVLASVSPERVGHLPAPLIERSEAVVVGPEAQAALGRLAAARRTLPRPSTATFVIPTAAARRSDGAADERYVDAAIEAARAAGLDAVEILLVVGDEFDGEPHQHAAADVRIVARPGPWNFSAAINAGVLEASHETVVLFNDDIEMLADGWVLPLVEHLCDPGVSMVGAALLYPDQTIQHLGVVIDDAFPLHPYVGQRLADLPRSATTAREVVAVTAACAVARRHDLLAVGGLNERLPASFNDIDLCFKLQRAVGRVVLEPAVPLLHHESASRTPTIEPEEWERFVGRWGEIVDPWYHPGHHRPDDPDDRRRNADHLPPVDPLGAWAVRTPMVQPRVHRARLQPPTETASSTQKASVQRDDHVS